MEGAYPIQLRMRSRMARAIRWPLTVYRYRVTGLPWRVACALTWWTIWYPRSEPRFWSYDERGKVKIRL